MTAASAILSVGFFVVTMVIVFILRASDQRTKSFKNIVSKLEKHENEIKQYDDEFQKDAKEIAEKLSEDSAQARDLLQNVAVRLADLKGYSEDLEMLHSTMASYQDAISALFKLTVDTEERMNTLKEEITSMAKIHSEIEELEASFESFKQEIDKKKAESFTQIDDKIYELEDKVKKVISSASGVINEAEKAATDLSEATQHSVVQDTEPDTHKISGVQVHETHNNIKIQDMDFDDDSKKETSEEIIFS